MTGQCPCRVGVGGQQCQSCLPGYFSLSDAGCSECSCGIGASNTSCDQIEGHCYCQPGVGADKCDECLPFYEGLKESGCSKCDACTEQLGNMAMSIQSNDLNLVSDKLSNLVALSIQGEDSLSSLQTSSLAVSQSVGEYRDELVQYENRITLINAAALNSSAQEISLRHSQIEDAIRVQGPTTDEEFTRVRILALEVEMVLGLLGNIQLTVLSLVPLLETQLNSARLVVASANQILSNAQFNYSSNLSRAMEILSLADAAHNRSGMVSLQLSAQRAQISLLSRIASSLNSSLQPIQYSLDRLTLWNSDNSELITATINSLLRADASVTNFYDTLNSSIVPQILEIQAIIQSSTDAVIVANEFYAAATQTLNGSSFAGHEYNLESGDFLISDRICKLRTSQANLNSSLLSAEAHQQELAANTTRIETYYNATQPVALEALAAITDYREVTRLITEACALANTSLQTAIAALQESVSLIELGILEQVELELRISRNLLNISIELESEANLLSSVEILALQVSINQTRDINDAVDRALSRARTNLESILTRVPFFTSQVNDILIRLPDLNACIATSSSTVTELLPELRRSVVEIVSRIINCSETIKEYEAQGISASILVNTTADALVERVHAISDSVRISDSNMAALQKLQATVGNIESIRDRAFTAIATLKVALSLRANSSLTYSSLAANVPLHYTQVSIYFMPTIRTGALFYIQTGPTNFVSLQLEGGVLSFSIDLGIGSVNLSIDGIALHQWYQVLATRDNQQLTMSLSSQQTDSIETRRVDGTIDSSLSLLFPPGSTIYLGHRPAQDESNLSNFEGCVADLTFNHMPIPLFKPLDSREHLTSCGMRPLARSYYLATWFYGEGYLLLDVPELLKPLNSSLTISIRTQRDGTVLYAAATEERTSISLSISQGRVRLEIGEGEQSGSLYPNPFVADNADHTVSILRDGVSINLQINDLPVGQLQLSSASFSVGTALRIGAGAESADSFSGVINELYIDGVIADLRQATNVSRAIPFSPTYVTPGVFHIGSGYAQFPLPQSPMSLLSIEFSFSTTSLTGLLLLLFADDSGSSPIHLSLEHGSLTLSYLYLGGFIPRQGVISLGRDLNEGDFHFVRIDFLSDKVTLSVDQLFASSTPLNCFAEASDCDIRVSTPLYVGGVPDSARLSIAVVTSYKGCIRDLRINDVMYNYTETNVLSGVSLYGCEPAPEAPVQTSTVVPTATNSLMPTMTTLIQRTTSLLMPSSPTVLHSISSFVTRSLSISTSTIEISVPSSLISSTVPVSEIPTSTPISISSSPAVSTSIPLLTSPIPESSLDPLSSSISQSIAMPVFSSSIVVPETSSISVPISSSPISVPISSPPISVPVSSPPISVPISSSPISVPISSSPISVPISSPPISVPISSSPISVPISSPPISVPISSSPISVPISSSPISVPISSSPISVPISSPPISVPISSPPISVPVSSPPISVPISSPPISVPVSSPPISVPISSPPISVPISSPPISSSPISVPISSSPISVPISSSPISVPISSPPISVPISSPPISSSPISVPISSSPISVPISSPPISVPISSSPISVPVSSPPISVPVSSPPISVPVSSPPISVPISSSPISVPISSPPISVPSSSSSIGMPVSIPLPISSSSVSMLMPSSTIPTVSISSSLPVSRRVSSVFIPQSSSLPPTVVTLPPSSPVITSSPSQPSISMSQPISPTTSMPTSSSSLVTPPPTTTTPTPTPPVNACQILPPLSPLEPYSAGYRFDSFNNSYILLDIDPSELATDTIFRIELSSNAYNGIIFFVNGLNNYDFIELKFLEGRLQFSFSLGSTPTRLDTSQRYDDGTRYRIEATRLGPIGLLSVLEVTGNNHFVPREYVRSPIHDRAFTLFDLSNNFYFGGRPNLQVSADMCVTSFLINNLQRLLSSGAQYQVNRCYSKISSGATFSGYGSYIQVSASYQVGRNFTAQFEFRTFNRTALLLYVANSVAGDHLTVELRGGSIVYSVDNGELGNANTITYAPDSPYYLCNGLWHYISLTKQDNYITLTVDGVRLERSIEDTLNSVDTNSYPLLVGGLSPGITPLSHVTPVSLTGCIRELFLNDVFIPLNSPEGVSYRVEVAGCIL